MLSVLIIFIYFYTGGWKGVIVRGYDKVDGYVGGWIFTCASVGKVQTKASHRNVRAEGRVGWSGMGKHAVMSKLPLIRT